MWDTQKGGLYRQYKLKNDSGSEQLQQEEERIPDEITAKIKYLSPSRIVK